MLEFPSLNVKKTGSLKCKEEMEMDIPPYAIHQFQNSGDEDLHLLIVTHPIISIKKGEEDIHFTLK